MYSMSLCIVLSQNTLWCWHKSPNSHPRETRHLLGQNPDVTVLIISLLLNPPGSYLLFVPRIWDSPRNILDKGDSCVKYTHDSSCRLFFRIPVRIIKALRWSYRS